MHTGILVTDGGAHSPEDWAYASAFQLLSMIKVSPESPKRAQLEMAIARITPMVASVLLRHVEKIQFAERKNLAEGNIPNSPELDPYVHTNVDHAIEEICPIVLSVLSNPQLFTKNGEIDSSTEGIKRHVHRAVTERLMTDFRTVMHIERDWHSKGGLPNNVIPLVRRDE